MSYNPNYNNGPGQWAAYPPQGGYQPMSSPNPGYSAPYAPQGPPPQAYNNNGYANEKDPYANGRFKPEKRFNDVVFYVLFVGQLLGFAALSGYVLYNFNKENGLGGGVGSDSTGTQFSLNQHTVYLLLFVTAAALLLSSLWLMLTRAFTRMIMHITLVLSIAMNVALCAYYWITKYYSAAIVFTVIALLSVLSYWGFRNRIPFSALLLQVVMDVSKHHTSVYAVAFASLFIQAALSVWFVFTAIATYTTWTPNNPDCGQGKSCSSGRVAGLIFFELFSYLWTSQVVGNVALATLAGGPYGAWYYFGPRELGRMPAHPTTGALARACTRSLGSIAFGSLVVTLLELLRLLFQAIRNNAAQNDNIVGVIFACCAECFVGCIEGMVQYFNRYAYIEIALYGKPYIAAAKDTWGLFSDRGITALVNDSLVGITLQWGAYVVGGLCSLFAYLYLRYTHPAYNADGQYTAPVVLFAFLIGAQCLLTLGAAIEAGVSTIFVGLAEDPQVLAERSPELFGMVAQTYPDVASPVRR